VSTTKLRWVTRNEDKPHRCPKCHAVATWDRRQHGPRSRAVCPQACGVQWRMGNRASRRLAVWWKRRETGGLLPLPSFDCRAMDR
jgi:hypothetical protein